MESIFATMFSKEYALQGYVLVKSLLTINQNQVIYILALDTETFDFFESLNLDSVQVVNIFVEPSLVTKFLNFQLSRRFNEAIFSIKPHWIQFVLNSAPLDAVVFYVDADSMFFGDLGELERSAQASLFLSPHYFAPSEVKDNKVGHYNAGFVGFRNNSMGQSAIQTWTNLCDQWCFAYISENRYADQKYLDNLSLQYRDHVLELPLGINLGNWSLFDNMKFSREDKQIKVDNQIIVSFHFHSVRLSKLCSHTDLERYRPLMNKDDINSIIYFPYLKALSTAKIDLGITLFKNWPNMPALIPKGMSIPHFLRECLAGRVFPLMR